MCGIVGYVGARQAGPILLEGLRRLEYRGYDSAGIAVQNGHAFAVRKLAGRVNVLAEALARLPLAGTSGIGHTRWATHGAPTDRNAPPHVDCSGAIAVIHNGIIENFAPLRAELEAAGHELRSETDTEVVAHLLEDALAGAGAADSPPDLAAAMRTVCRRLHGAFTLVALHAGRPDVVVGARRNSPLVLGVGTGEMFLASDVAAFIAYTRDAVELGQDQVVELGRDGYEITDFAGTAVSGTTFHVDWELAAAEKGG